MNKLRIFMNELRILILKRQLSREQKLIVFCKLRKCELMVHLWLICSHLMFNDLLNISSLLVKDSL